MLRVNGHRNADPIHPSILGVVQSVSALVLEARGHWFDSTLLDQFS